MANEMNSPLDKDSAIASSDNRNSDDSHSDDVRIRSLLEAVSIPDQLNSRIKARLRTAMLVNACSQDAFSGHELANQQLANQSDATPGRPTETIERELVGSESAVESSGDAASTRQAGIGDYTRRALLILAMAAGLAGFAYLANQWRQPNEREWLVKQSQTILDNWEHDNPANLAVDTDLADLPAAVREQLTRVTLRGTRSIVALGSKFKGTLYQLEAVDGRSLILMRLKEMPTVRGMNSRFDTLPTPSGGWSLMALQLNNETFVLAAACTQQQLMNYVRQPVVT